MDVGADDQVEHTNRNGAPMDHPDVLYRLMADHHRDLERSARTSRLAARRPGGARAGALARLAHLPRPRAGGRARPSHRLG